MTFKDTQEGQTHSFNDGCGDKEHNKECKCELDGFQGAITSQNCSVHTKPQPQGWEERLMDQFCVMFERATRENDSTDWVAKLEQFITALLTQKEAEKKALVRELVGTIASVRGYHLMEKDSTKQEVLDSLFEIITATAEKHNVQL